MSVKGKLKGLLLIPALIVGVLVFMALVKSKRPPERTRLSERVVSVRVVQAGEIAMVPRAIGYGNVEPNVQWQAIAEVGGKIVKMHPELKPGAILSKGEMLFQIDQMEYGLAESRDQADLANLLAQIRELEQRENNYRRILATETRALHLSEQELLRKRQLVAKGTISKSEVDREEKSFLSQKQAVQNLLNSLDLLPAERQALEARLSSSRNKLQDTQLDVGKTTITAPFDLRVESVDAELSQYAAPGKVLLEAYDIAMAEIPAQIPIAAMRNVVSPQEKMGFINRSDFSMDKLRELLGLTAIVRLAFDVDFVEWKARFARMGERIDPQTRTIPIYVQVDDPYLKAVPGKRPPLVKNMYVQVEVRGKALPPGVILPRSALHFADDVPVVHVVGRDNRLEFRPVKLRLRLGSLALLEGGVSPGEQVIVSDLVPAIEGQLLDVKRDQDMEKRIIEEATGEAPLQ